MTSAKPGVGISMPCLNAAARLAGPPSTALDPKTARVGCIGLGAMGSKMCSNLASRCGTQLLAHDAYAPLVDAAVAAGCGAARSLADFAEVELLVLSLPSPIFAYKLLVTVIFAGVCLLVLARSL